MEPDPQLIKPDTVTNNNTTAVYIILESGPSPVYVI